MDEFSGSARALVFVVDSNTVSKQVRDVAEYLHFLLSNKNINSNRWGRVKVDSFHKFCSCYQGTQKAHTVYSFFILREKVERFLVIAPDISLCFSPPLLIVCNKQDSGMAKSAAAVQALLEKEIEKVFKNEQMSGQTVAFIIMEEIINSLIIRCG